LFVHYDEFLKFTILRVRVVTGRD